MNKFLKTFLFSVLFVFLAAGCAAAKSTPTTAVWNYNSGQQGEPTEAAGQVSMNRDVLDSYAAEFQIQFNGTTQWSYWLTTRKSGTLREVHLHIEGLPEAQNPGDIRLVTDGKQSWMIGDGTDGECIQFPNQQGMDPTFIYPESLVSPQLLSAVLTLAGEEAGSIPLQHFQANGAAVGSWKNATINLWQEKTGGMLRQFAIEAEGEDPFFSAGSGKLMANYKVSTTGEQAIEPVTGCEISVTLPESATMFVRLPGMASFESPSSAAEIQQFFQTMMPQEDWGEIEPAAQKDGATVLSYHREAEEVQIVIEDRSEGGSMIKLLFMQNQ